MDLLRLREWLLLLAGEPERAGDLQHRAGRGTVVLKG